MFRFNDGRDWFLRRRLGLFLHWGLYAINGIQEQEQQRCGVPADEYRKLIGKFNPRRFDPDGWVDFALRNGFEYMVITAKHHDGFCLWPSRETEFHVGSTPSDRISSPGFRKRAGSGSCRSNSTIRSSTGTRKTTRTSAVTMKS